MTKCNYCGIESEEPKGYSRNFCDSCLSDKEIGVPKLIETVVLNGSYRTTKARIAELERRVMIPGKGPDGDYAIGRLGENGKVQEKEPDYR